MTNLKDINPRLKRVRCCLNCDLAKVDYDWAIDCSLSNTEVQPDMICDKYKESITNG